MSLVKGSTPVLEAIVKSGTKIDNWLLLESLMLPTRPSAAGLVMENIIINST